MNTRFRKFSLSFLLSLFFLAAFSRLGAQPYTLTTVAGAEHLRNGKAATTVPLRRPQGAIQDAQGNLYICDRDDHRIRKVDAAGIMTTLAGTGRSGYSGDGGPAIQARLSSPISPRLDGKGNLLFVDFDNFVIRKINLSTGVITPFAGTGDGRWSGDNGLATAAGMDPFDIAIDGAGNVYLSDTSNHRIRKVAAATGVITTIAGVGVPGYFGENGDAKGAALDTPLGMDIDAQGNLYFVDGFNLIVRKIDAATNVITRYAGDGFFLPDGDNGLAINAGLGFPVSVALEPNGDLLIATLNLIRRVTKATGIIRHVAGSANTGYSGDSGSTTTTVFGSVNRISVAPNGDALVSDFANYRIRRIRGTAVTTIAGTAFTNGIPALEAFLNGPSGIVTDGRGGLVFADRRYHQVRGIAGGQISRIYGDGYATAELTRLNGPYGVARDSGGNVYIADSLNNRVLRYVPGGSASIVAGGNGFGFSGDSSLATSAKLADPEAVAVDDAGTFYIADVLNCRIRRVRDGVITTIAGKGQCNYSGDGGPATEATLSAFDLALDGKGNLFVADFANHRIRKIDLTTGIISTVAGVGTPGYSGDGGPAGIAQISLPIGIAVDSRGNLFFAEYGNSVVRMVQNGTIRTIAGIAPEYVSNGESGPGIGISFDPVKLTVDVDGSIYVSDDFNDRIRKLTPAVPGKFRIVSGEGGSGPPGTKVQISTELTEASGTPVGGALVRFAVTGGSATLSSVVVATSATGIATIQVTLGETAGPVTVSATTDGVSPLTFHLEVVPPSASIDAGGVFGAGLSVPPVRALSTGAILTAFGTRFGAGPSFRRVGTADLVNGKVPTNFRGICVEVGAERAFVFGASDTQINFQAPRMTPGGNVQVTVITGCGTPQERRTNSIAVASQAASPEFFYFATNLDGRNPVAATDTVTGSGIAPVNLFPGSGFGPAHGNQYVTIYATGFGDTNPAVTPGDFPTAAASATGAVRVLLNGRVLPAENILYAGVTPFSPGLFQLNLLLPADTPSGDLSIVIEIGGVSSPPGAYITVAP